MLRRVKSWEGYVYLCDNWLKEWNFRRRQRCCTGDKGEQEYVGTCRNAEDEGLRRAMSFEGLRVGVDYGRGTTWEKTVCGENVSECEDV